MKKMFAILLSITLVATSGFSQSQTSNQESLASKEAKINELKSELSSVQLQLKAFRIGRNVAATILVPITALAVIATGIGIRESIVREGGEEREAGKGLAFIAGTGSVVVGGVTYATLKITNKQMEKLEVHIQKVTAQLDAEQAAIQSLKNM